MSERNTNAVRHGHCNYGIESPTYKSWKAMKRRCLNKKSNSFKNYGAKGISFCEEWSSFDAFLADMGVRPKGTSLERIDGSLNYCKENCVWATRKDQNRNRVNVRLNLKQAREIYARAMAGEPHNKIANDYGCSKQLVSNIKTGKAWLDAKH